MGKSFPHGALGVANVYPTIRALEVPWLLLHPDRQSVSVFPSIVVPSD